MRKFLVLMMAWLSVHFIFAQETITVMQYNLTYYGQTTSWCTTSNNNVSSKDGYLTTIVDYVNPDVFCVNELGIVYSGGDNIIADRLLNNVMGAGYARAEHTGTSNICNMIYYNTTKLGFAKQSHINKDLNGSDIIREIDFYTLYYKDADLATHQDTIYMTFCVAHLKAGSQSTDETERDKATAAAMKHIDDYNIRGNVFFMGDMNLYTDQEPAYQNLTNYSNSAINFYDPINQEGDWHNGNSQFGAYHTQSTRDDSNTNSDCFSGGGMDDRFDFILINQDVRDNLSGVQYRSGSYKALGQDGSASDNNSPLNTSSNSAVSTTIAQALFDMSDHLPVVLELDVKQGPLSIDDSPLATVNISNPVSDKINIRISTRKVLDKVTFEIYNTTGQLVFTDVIPVNSDYLFHAISAEDLSKGMYIIKATNTDGSLILNEKLVKLQ